MARRKITLGIAGAAVVAVSACSSILDVDNPNAVAEDALSNPAAAGALANGILAATVRMLSGTTVPYSVATDELDWIGSRDAWRQLDYGILGDYINEFTDQAFPFVGEARYLGDAGIGRLEGFNTAGTLANRVHLARAYLYTAIVYASIADMYDDYAFSNKTVGKAPIGRANMSRMYDSSVVYLDRANTLVNAAGAAADMVALRYPILAYRARAKHAKAVHALVTPKGSTAPANPLVNDAGAVADANAALGVAGVTADQRFTLTSNLEATAGINIWFEVNGRNEHRTGTYYRTLNDPLTGALDPTVQALLTQFAAFGTQAGVFTITSNRELRLILAEAALQAGNIPAFTTEINAVRAFDSKPAWTGAVGEPTAQAMLIHERTAQLWLMRRRLLDMHRFGLKDVPLWRADPTFESTFNVVGLLFPIPNVERLGNTCISSPSDPGCQ